MLVELVVEMLVVIGGGGVLVVGVGVDVGEGRCGEWGEGASGRVREELPVFCVSREGKEDTEVGDTVRKISPPPPPPPRH